VPKCYCAGLITVKALVALGLIMGSAYAAGPPSHKIRIRLVDGHNGHPVTRDDLNVWVWDESKAAAESDLREGHKGLNAGFLLKMDRNGEAEVPLEPSGSESIKVSPDDYVDCRPFQKNAPRPVYSVREILESGIATENTCGKIRLEANPGELILFVRRPHFWEVFQR